MVKIDTSELKERMSDLHAGDRVLLSGIVYTARDAAHKRLISMLENGEKLPFDLEGAVIYYAGPTPAKNGLAVGSCGPTTSSRMDVFSPILIERGLTGMIGKGQRSPEVIESMKKHGAIYFCAIGGAGALASKAIKNCDIIAFPELGCESFKKMYIEYFSLIVGIDGEGNNIFNR